ncbi:MAG TPA: peptidase S16, partial [Solirubrobacteraceae bacterium]|nr:peptidase S16 [Solirubrobacteraceae bacterium]
TDRELSEDELLELDAYGMAATVEFGVEAKQELLELRSENARLRLLTMLLSAAIERLDQLERAQARALSNGKVRFA